MMTASTEGALAFVKGLGAVHALSDAAGRLAKLRLHHGTLNAVLLPAVLRFSLPAAAEKGERIAQAMGLSGRDVIADTVTRRNAELGLPATLGAWASRPR